VYELTLDDIGAWNTTVTPYNGAEGSGNWIATTTNSFIGHVKSSTVTTLPNGLSAQKEFLYDAPWTAKPTAIKEWNYYTGSPSGTPTRETDYSYSGFDLHQVTVLDGGVQSAQTTYDFTSSATATSGVPQHSTTSIGGPYLQKITQWLNTGNSPVTTYVMDDTGMVKSISDPKGNPSSTISYQCSNAVPYQTINPLGHTTTYGYDCNSGAITSVKDPNDVAANRAGTIYQYEGAGRLQSISYPDGGQTSYSYPSATEVDTAVLATPNPTISSQQILDSFGRPWMRIQEGVSTETSYDSNGRVHCTTNPHFTASSSSTDGSTCITSYDGLDRPLTQSQSDGTSTVSWSYNGNVTTFTDEASHSWQRTTDAFGRLTKVVEPNSAETDYTYALTGTSNQTVTVSKKGTSSETPRPDRIFTSDSLGRNISANAPESGSTSYTYDNNGNLHTKTDNRGVQATYTYDALNRFTDKTFSDGTTPGQHLRYDQTSGWAGTQNNTIGRVSQAYSDVDMRYFGTGAPPACNPRNSATANYNPSYGNPTYCNWTDELYSYDTMGRPVYVVTAFPSEAGWSAHGTAMSYDLAGDMTSLTYPDGRVVTQGFDGAGNLQTVTFDNWNGQHVGYTYASGFTYTPGGAQTEVTYGNGVYIHTPYNSRQQMCQVWSQNGPQVLIDTHIYFGNSTDFCANVSANNGNITQIKDWRNQARTRYFGYDPLNRLNSFSNGDGSMQQGYSYDSFGNMSQSSGTLTFSPAFRANNQINASGFNYDDAGNLYQTNIAGVSSTYDFDGASRIFRFNSGAAYYAYDGNGNRMRRDADGSYTEYQYLNGQPIAEKHPDGTWSDYIYANGQRIASASTADPLWHTHGVRDNSINMGCGTVWDVSGTPSSLSGYVIRQGDKMAYDQKQIVAHAGASLRFTDGSFSTVGSSPTDGDGNVMNDSLATDGTWHHRIFDLSLSVGKTVQEVVTATEADTPAGTWDVWYKNMAIFSTDGVVHPVFTGQPLSGSAWSDCGGHNLSFGVEPFGVANGNPNDAPVATTYYVHDHLGSTPMTMAGGGWPISTSTFYPFGQEQSPTTDPNHYRFAGLERDGETGLDHATFRQYSSTQGRWLAPDPYLGSMNLADPQSFNRYSYVANSPLTGIDPTGLKSEGPGYTFDPIQDIYVLLSHLFGAGSPGFNGSLTPRPGNHQIWDEHGANGGFPVSPYSSIAAMIGDVDGLYPAGCEFGDCGNTFAQGNSPSNWSKVKIAARVSWGMGLWWLFRNPEDNPEWPGNGSLTPNFDKQDGVCTTGPFAPKMNSNPAILACCKAHDDCYTKNRCNASSWVPLPDGLNGGACRTVCNAAAVGCVGPLILK
jgi:RHS repeat-associated protein